MSNFRIKALLKRRAMLQAEYDRQISQPESYSITGSVSATNRKLDDLQKQIDKIDSQIAAEAGGDGIQRSYPNYRH